MMTRLSMNPRKYRKKPVVVDVIRWYGTNHKEIQEFVGEMLDPKLDFVQRVPILTISTLEGEMIARPGDYIIKGIRGEVYPCKPDIFKETYEEVEGTTETQNEKCRAGHMINRLTAERDAAVSALKKHGYCLDCSHEKNGDCEIPEYPLVYGHCDNWQWRGVVVDAPPPMLDAAYEYRGAEQPKEDA